MFDARDTRAPLDALTEFNKALIYCFDPESPSSSVIEGEGYNSSGIFRDGQIEDLLNGYLFIQNEILPSIKRDGIQALTPEQLLIWIKGIHAHMGKTLVGERGQSAGEYTTRPLLRWRLGLKSDMVLLLILEGKDTPGVSMVDEFLGELSQANREAFGKFVVLMSRLAEANEITIHATLLEKDVSYSHVTYSNAINRLITLWNDNKISDKAREVASKIVIVGDYPERLPARMQAFTEWMLAAWKQLRADDLTALSQFCAEFFSRFTDTHGFYNGNGRVATALVNIVLKSLGLPDIVLRKPMERYATEGAYAIAMDCIETDRSYLARLIADCIREAQQNPFADKNLEGMVNLKLQTLVPIRKIKAMQPDFDFNTTMDRDVEKLNLPVPADPYDSRYRFLAYRAALPEFIKIADKLASDRRRADTPAVANQTSNSAASSALHSHSVTRSFDPTNLKVKMAELTHVAGWKIPEKGDLYIWREFDNHSQADTALAIVKAGQFCQAKVANRKDTGKPIITCTQIDVNKLLSITPESLSQDKTHCRQVLK